MMRCVREVGGIRAEEFKKIEHEVWDEIERRELKDHVDWDDERRRLHD